MAVGSRNRVADRECSCSRSRLIVIVIINLLVYDFQGRMEAE